MLKNFYFTFGSNHRTESGMCLGYCYVVIPAESFGQARQAMVDARGDKWAFQYDEGQDFGKEQFGLVEVGLSEVRL